jgi:hypothetical protein
MPALAELHRAVAATIASKRLGTIVFAAAPCRTPTRRLRRYDGADDRRVDWVGQQLDRLHAFASHDGEQVALTLQFAEGRRHCSALEGPAARWR